MITMRFLFILSVLLSIAMAFANENEQIPLQDRQTVDVQQKTPIQQPPVQQQFQQPPVQQQFQQPSVQQQFQQPPDHQQFQQPPDQQQFQQPPVQQQFQQPPGQQQFQPPPSQHQFQQLPIQQQFQQPLQQQFQQPPAQQQFQQPPQQFQQPSEQQRLVKQIPPEQYQQPHLHNQPPPQQYHQFQQQETHPNIKEQLPQPGSREYADIQKKQRSKDGKPLIFMPSELSEFDSSPVSLTVHIQPKVKQCFYHRAVVDFNMEYQVIYGGDLDIDVFVNSPAGFVVYDRKGKSSGEHRFEVTEEDKSNRQAFMICLDNRHVSRGPKFVYFELDVDPDRTLAKKDRDLNKPVETPEELQEVELTLDTFHKSMDRVELFMLKSQHHQRKIQNLESTDRSTMEENYNRVNMWSIFQLIVMAVVGFIQVFMIRSLFDERSRFHGLWKRKT